MRLGITLITLLLTLGFSWWLMVHTFSYDSQRSHYRLSDKVWSDFAWSLPLVRSFSLGQNWPPESPIFPGLPIKYHIVFYTICAALERLGFRLDMAVNIPSSLGLWGMLVAVYTLAWKLYKKTSIALLAVIFTIFNGSLTWFDFFTKYRLSDLAQLSKFVAFGPWDGSAIAAAWTLNIFTNQRHLGISLFLFLILLIHFNSRKLNAVVIALVMTILLWLNFAIFVVGIVFVVWQLFISKQKSKLLEALIMLVPMFLIQTQFIGSSGQISFEPGFLSKTGGKFPEIVIYLFLNFGLHLFLVPLGLLWSEQKIKYLIFPIGSIMLIGFLFRLSPDMFNNHKLFNAMLILGSIFSAYAIFKLSTIKLIGRIMAMILIIFTTLSGVIDLMPIINDRKIVFDDQTLDSNYFRRNTSPKAVVLNSTWLFNPASLAGRKIFNGYSYFTWSHGYNNQEREEITKSIYRSRTKDLACRLLTQNAIDYVELNSNPEEFLQPNFDLWYGQFKPSFYNPKSGITVYDVHTQCK